MFTIVRYFSSMVHIDDTNEFKTLIPSTCKLYLACLHQAPCVTSPVSYDSEDKCT